MTVGKFFRIQASDHGIHDKSVVIVNKHFILSSVNVACSRSGITLYRELSRFSNVMVKLQNLIGRLIKVYLHQS